MLEKCPMDGCPSSNALLSWDNTTLHRPLTKTCLIACVITNYLHYCSNRLRGVPKQDKLYSTADCRSHHVSEPVKPL